MRVELRADGVDVDDLRLVEGRGELLQRELDAGPERVRRGVAGGEGRFQRVLDRQQVLGEILDRVLVRLRDVVGRLLADVLGVGAGAQPRVLQLRRLVLGLLEERRDIGGRVGGVRIPGRIRARADPSASAARHHPVRVPRVFPGWSCALLDWRFCALFGAQFDNGGISRPFNVPRGSATAPDRPAVGTRENKDLKVGTAVSARSAPDTFREGRRERYFAAPSAFARTWVSSRAAASGGAASQPARFRRRDRPAPRSTADAR